MADLPSPGDGDLTPDSVRHFLGPDPQQADDRYWRLRQKLIMYFAGRRSPSPEDDADESMYRLVRKLSEGVDVGSIEAYLFGIARNVWRENQQRHPAPPPTPAEPVGPWRRCLRRCLRQLDAEARETLEAFLLDGEREALARRLGVSRNALGIRVHRAKAKVRPCLTECLAGEGIVLKR